MRYLSCISLILLLSLLHRDELGQKPSVSSGNAKAGHTDIDGSLFRNGTKADGMKKPFQASTDTYLTPVIHM